MVFMLLAILGVFFTLSMGSLAGYHLWLASFVLPDALDAAIIADGLAL